VLNRFNGLLLIADRLSALMATIKRKNFEADPK
jgi:hypothetical protein